MPNRIIKESIKRSPQIDRLSWFEEVVYYRLIVSADDYGCCDGRRVLLRNDLFPTKDSVTKKAVEDAIANLVSVGLLCEYTVNGMPYLLFPTWEKHQRIRNKHRKYPEPPANLAEKTLDGHLTAIRGQMTADCPSESESNPNQNQNPNRNSPLAGGSAPAREAAPTARQDVIAAYTSRINPTPSETCIAELTSFCDSMGADVCLRAFDIALDEKKTAWSYIRAILRDKKRQGVRSLADWDALAQRKKPETGGNRKSWTEIAAEMEAGE